MKYKDEKELLEVVRGFETGTIKESEWHHAEHLIVASRYVRVFSHEEALDRLNRGINQLLKAFGVDTTNGSPYHETLTVFWLRVVGELREANRDLDFFDFCRLAVDSFDKEYPLNFYTRDRLFSDEARRTFVEPDLTPLNIR